MRQLLFFSLLLALTGLSGCFWNTKLPYQESMNTYVDSSETLLVQARTVADYRSELCKSYRPAVKAINKLGTTANTAGCDLDTFATETVDYTQIIDAGLMYHELIEQHSPDSEGFRGKKGISNAGKTVATECVKEGSKCAFEWISGTRLTVLQSTSEQIFSSYVQGQTHEALSQYITNTTDTYMQMVDNIINYLTDIQDANEDVVKVVTSNKELHCKASPGPDACNILDETLKAYENEEQKETLTELINQLEEHKVAHRTFKDEVMSNDTRENRKKRLLDFAQGVLKTGIKVHEAF